MEEVLLDETYSEQYGTVAVVIPSLPVDPDRVIEHAYEKGCTYDSPDGEEFVVQFPGRPIELYTERALRSSCKA